MGRAGAAWHFGPARSLASAFSDKLLDFCAVEHNGCKLGRDVRSTQKSHFLEGKDIFTCCSSFSPLAPRHGMKAA